MTVFPSPRLSEARPQAASSSSTGQRPVVAQPVRRSVSAVLRQSWTALVLGLLLVVFVAMFLPHKNDLEYYGDPSSPAEQGTLAMVEILRQQGVEVTVVRESQLPHLDAHDTVLLTASLSPDEAEQTTKKLLAAGRIVVPASAAEGFNVPGNNTDDTYPTQSITITHPYSGGDRAKMGFPAAVKPGCAVLVGDIKRLEVTEGMAEKYLTTAQPCVEVASLPVVSLLPIEDAQLPGTHAEVAFISDLRMFYNSELDKADNAALMTNLLGSTGKLVVVKPHKGAAPSLLLPLPWELFPTVLRPLTYALVLLVVTYMFYRARRFGPLAYERLPVRIDASETVQALGSLLQSSGNVDVPSTILQRQARHDLGRKLGLGTKVSPHLLVRAVAQATGRSSEESAIYRLLFEPFAGSRADLVEWEKQLGRLLEEANNDARD